MVLFIWIIMSFCMTFAYTSDRGVPYHATNHLVFDFNNDNQLRHFYIVNETGLNGKTYVYLKFKKEEDQGYFDIRDTDLNETRQFSTKQPNHTFELTYPHTKHLNVTEILKIIFIERNGNHIYSKKKLLKYDSGSIVYEFSKPENVTLYCVNFRDDLKYSLIFDDAESDGKEVTKTWHNIGPGFNNRTYECIAEEDSEGKIDPVKHKESVVFRYIPPVQNEIKTTVQPTTQGTTDVLVTAETQDLLWLWIVLAMGGISILTLLVSCAYTRCRNNNSQILETGSVLTRRTESSIEFLNKIHEEPKSSEPSELYYSYARPFKTQTYNDNDVSGSSTSYETIKDKPTINRVQVNNADYTLVGKKTTNNGNEEELYDGYNVIKEKPRPQERQNRNNDKYHQRYVNGNINIPSTTGKHNNDNSGKENNRFKNDLQNAIAQRNNSKK